ncbi:glycosyltransferase family 2 protein [Uliginosibacterium sediminicola]|uniref:Glycosyltransferase family 2 protein n=1 Tax=Uliginosibacterium sediminicola TaxID=2024550 RepID=A0ABU9Z193_9RHOO
MTKPERLSLSAGTPAANAPRLGDVLLERGLITPAQQARALDLSRSWRVRFGEVVIAMGWTKSLDLFRTLAAHLGAPFVDLLAEPPDAALLHAEDAPQYMAQLLIPWRKRADGVLIVATAAPGEETTAFIARKWGLDVEIVITSKFDIIWTIQRSFDRIQSHDAVHSLSERDPLMSAKQIITPEQLIFIYALLSLLALGLIVSPVATLIAANTIMGLWYLGNFIFKGLLVWHSEQAQDAEGDQLSRAAQALRDEDLPVVTVLVPMFREPEVLPILTHALRNLQYPRSKLDIKLVLEAGDHETIQAAQALGLEGIFEILRVPPSHPQTKPKACNYAMRFARGEYLVIYDAEDKPEPDQLRKVVAAFQRSPANTACIQCRLNYYNAHENWLTRMFTLDYSLLFDLLLPGLERLKVPIPLGGTSNHFRLDVLRELNGWDPFNVTEDADLGIRLTQKGYRVGVIDSTTYEEANVAIGNWIRQRSRWIKGYMVTFLVHTRRPIHLVRATGIGGALGFTFFVGGTVLSALLNPLYWLMLLLWTLSHASGFERFFPPLLGYLSLFNLLAGNGAFVYLSMLAPLRRRWVDLVPYSLSIFAYWGLMSVAAYKALWQLVYKPFYWEKTQHGLSTHTAAELAKAKAAMQEGNQ